MALITKAGGSFREKAQDQINNLVNKVNEVTSKKTSEEETIAE